MRTFAISFLLGGTSGSHFRAGTYAIAQTSNGLGVSRTQTWRRSKDGYTPQCEQTHIDNKTPAALFNEECVLDAGGSCGSFPSKISRDILLVTNTII